MTKQDDIASVKRQLRDLKPNRLIISIPYVLIVLILLAGDISFWYIRWFFGLGALVLWLPIGILYLGTIPEVPSGTKSEDYHLKYHLKVALRDVRKEKS